SRVEHPAASAADPMSRATPSGKPAHFPMALRCTSRLLLKLTAGPTPDERVASADLLRLGEGVCTRVDCSPERDWTRINDPEFVSDRAKWGTWAADCSAFLLLPAYLLAGPRPSARSRRTSLGSSGLTRWWSKPASRA